VAAVTITVSERYQSSVQTGENASAEVEYLVTGTSDRVAAVNALVAAVPSTHVGLVIQHHGLEWHAPNAWIGTAYYGRLPAPEPESISYQFETGGGTQHISQSLATLGNYAASGTPPDYGGAIGVTESGVEGVDIVVPQYSFTLRRAFDPTLLTLGFEQVLFALTGTTNLASWKGFAAGEVLFLGASGSGETADLVELDYRFSASPNVASLTVGAITGITKGGHDYLWVRYRDHDNGQGRLVKVADSVHVERVYLSSDFSALGLGV
jgi:hypothetical protein